MSNEKYAEILEKAADMLESEEAMWIRDDFETLMDAHTGLMGHCGVGALCKAAGEPWGSEHPMTTEALGYVKPYVIDPVAELAMATADVPSLLPSRENWDAESAMIMFNDRIAVGKEEVIDVFKQAAKDLRNQA